MKRVLKWVLPIVFWLGLWALAAWRTGQPLLLPTPWEVAARLGELAVTGEFWRAALHTLGRVFLGGALGVVTGTAVAVLSAQFPWLDWLTAPAMRVVRATPVASFIILIWLWTATAWVPAVVAGLMSAPVVWGAVAQGIRGTDPQLLEMARAYRFSRGKTLRLVYVPSVIPAFTSGCRTAMGLAWKAGVAAEALCLPKAAIGTQVYYSKLYLETPDLFAWTAVVVALSFLMEKGLGRLLERGARRGAP